MKTKKRKDTLLVSWSCLYTRSRAKHRMARCKVLMTRKVRSRVTGKPFIEVRIRDPKGRLWWHA
jgi:hypothetical protein